MEGDLGASESGTVSAKVREELARRRLSRQWLADEARISISTLEKALSGRRPFSLGTVVRMEEALGITLRSVDRRSPASPTGLAPEEMGAYARVGVSWLEGEYLTLRPSFGEPGVVYAYETFITWDDACGCLRFTEAARLDPDFRQEGFVSFPNLSGHIYLVTNRAGQYRLAILGRPSANGAMNGVLTTLVAGKGSQLTPAAAPISLVPVARVDELALGLVRPGDRCYEPYRERLERITDAGYAAFPILSKAI
ncbi:MAG TPA: helix-turn-helix transcriptional regulator [Allosphingosinicella sp.]